MDLDELRTRILKLRGKQERVQKLLALSLAELRSRCPHEAIIATTQHPVLEPHYLFPPVRICGSCGLEEIGPALRLRSQPVHWVPRHAIWRYRSLPLVFAIQL